MLTPNAVLAVMSSLFDSWFGFIFWAVAWYRMRNVDRKAGVKQNPLIDGISIVVNVVILLTGFLFLSAGTYASVQGIIDAYDAGTVPGVFSCRSNGI
jgi:hypothetical protein